MKKTVSVLGKNVDIIFPNQEKINEMTGEYCDTIDLGNEIFLRIHVIETHDDRFRKHFKIKTTVFVNRCRIISEHTTVPVTSDKVLETLSHEIDITLEFLKSNIEAIYVFSKRDTEKFGELVAKFDSTKAKTAKTA